MNEMTTDSGRLRRAVLWSTLVVVLTWWTAREVVDFDFVAWDDEYNILINPHLGPPNADNLGWMFTDTHYMRRYVPFGWLGFSLVYGVSGLSPSAYHTANLALHVSNAFFLFLLLAWAIRRWVCPSGDPRIEASAATGALLWAVHPLRAETVGWSSGMLYSFATFFALASVLAYCRALDTRSGFRRLMALILYGVSILTYPITIGLVAVFIGIEITEARRAKLQAAVSPIWKKVALRVLPFIAASLAGVTITLIARLTANAFWGHAPTLADVEAFERIMRGCYTIAHYIKVTLWPLNLTPFPTQLDQFSPFEMRALVSAFLLLAITWLCWWRRARHGGALLLWMIYLALLGPMLGFTEKLYYPSDRYMYLPAMTASVAVAALLAASRHRLAWLIGVPAGLAILVLLATSPVQLRVWRDSPSLFARAASAAANSRLSSDVFQRWATFHTARGNIAAAEAVLAAAERQGVPPAASAVIVANIEQARAESRSGAVPLVARIHTDVAKQLARDGRHREAAEHFAAAVAITPQSASLRYNQAMHAAGQGDARRALGLLLVALAHADGSISPTAQRHAWSLIAIAFAQSGETTLARAAEKRAQNPPPS
jgi:tetratricopeptide (TPR) repeat protein